MATPSAKHRMAGKRDRALLALGWAAAMRRSELVALAVEDVETVPGGIHVHIRKSKTDQEGAGQVIAVPDRVRDRIRPVAALRAWSWRMSQTSSEATFLVRPTGNA
jgi:integrase